MEVQRTLGYGFSEAIYKDAIEMEFGTINLLYPLKKNYRSIIRAKKLQHRFFADFICYNQIILEEKFCDKGITEDHLAQTLNYLRVSGHTIWLIINFGKRRLEYRRLMSIDGSQ